MSSKEETRTRRLIIYFTPEEYASLLAKFHSTTHRYFTVYIRDLIQKRSVVVRYRNQSVDEFLPIANKIKNELEIVCKNFNQAVQKLNNLPHQDQLPDVLEYLAAEAFNLSVRTQEIKDRLIKIHQQCSQK